MLTKNGKKPLNCLQRDFSNGATTQWDPSQATRDYMGNQCFIRDRAWATFEDTTDYQLKMTIDDDTEAGTATVKCWVDGELYSWYTDPCPLTGGEYGLEVSRNAATFAITSFTDRSCDDVPVVAEQSPSLTDGLTLTGNDESARFWKSTGQDTVTHMFAGTCNQPRPDLQNTGGQNRAKPGRSVMGNFNNANLAGSSCVKDGFIDADVTLKYDFLNRNNGELGTVGLTMRNDASTGDFGYRCNLEMARGKVEVYRGGYSRSISGSYLTGRYKCSSCTCDHQSSCDQFNFVERANTDNRGNDLSQWILNQGDAHNMRMEMSTASNGLPRIKCFLNGTLVQDITDGQGRQFNGNQPTRRNKACGDFGLATIDSDVVSFKVNGYTGQSPPKDGSDIIISEYIEGSSWTKAIELFNPTSSDISLDGTSLQWHHNGNVYDASMNYDIPASHFAGLTIAAGQTFTICKDKGSNKVDLAKCDMLVPDSGVFSHAVAHNGDDAIELKYEGNTIDVIGIVGTDPGSCWRRASDNRCYTKDKTIRRKNSVTSPSATWDISQWDLYSKDQVNGIGGHAGSQV